ncbi:MAG TPA: polysaccharide deacetylase family protein [Actinomycetota bacterium]
MQRAARPRRRGYPFVVTLLVLGTAGLASFRGGAFHGLAQAEPRIRTSPVGDRAVAEPSERRLLAALHPNADVVSKEQQALAHFAALGLPIYCGGPDHPFVALTFDDGPGPYTKTTLQILANAGAPATFFLVGRNLQYWPDLPRRELAAGALGDHTWTHRDMRGATAQELYDEIDRTRQGIGQASGTSPGLFRPPLGARDQALETYLQARAMVDVIWSVDSRDSDGATPQEVLANVTAGLRPGAIVLMHENRGSTLSMLPQIMAAVRASGLRPVTVPYLLAYDPPSEEQVRSHACGTPAPVASASASAT